MGSSESNNHSAVDRGSKIPDERTKVVKKKTGGNPHKNLRQGLLYRNGLMNTAIAARSDMMKIAKRNSNESPLLRLPAEIRSKIWEYAVGYHQIEVYDAYFARTRLSNVQLSHVSRPLRATTSGFVKPKYALPTVCRQIYVEAAAMVYTLNNFRFDDRNVMDCFIKHRALGQRRLITSVDVSIAYFRLYTTGARKLLRQTFPNIKRIGVPIVVAHNAQHISPNNSQKELLEDAKKRVVNFVKQKEGSDLKVEWYGECSQNFMNLHFW
ncbi:hypothetical protein PTMSG1_07831 [Pyrenophora teres f. maculata]|nr:hypothetical protein PTMSG1_07831 [Pyrenophora teres f. maculata]